MHWNSKCVCNHFVEAPKHYTSPTLFPLNCKAKGVCIVTLASTLMPVKASGRHNILELTPVSWCAIEIVLQRSSRYELFVFKCIYVCIHTCTLYSMSHFCTYDFYPVCLMFIDCKFLLDCSEVKNRLVRIFFSKITSTNKPEFSLWRFN